ncbi:MAG: HD domain-containing phosphohydrolase [Myxococcota bacterium]|nr:HD domain-containing phosphohydrolase [Myxococcota bacterium]
MTEVQEVTGADLGRINSVGKRFSYRIATLIRTARIHKMSNKALDNPLAIAASSATTLYQDLGEATLQGEGDVIHINKYRIRVERAQIPQIRFLNTFLHERGVGGFEVLGSTLVEDWRHVLQLILDAPLVEDDLPAAVRLNEELSQRGVEVVRFSRRMQLSSGAVGGVGGGEGESVRISGTRSLQLYLRALRVVRAFYRRESSLQAQGGLTRIMQYLVEQAIEEPRQHLALVQIKGDHAYSLRHPVNTAILSIALGHRLGLKRGALMDLGLATITGDLGMREVSEGILEKKEALTDEEREVLQSHPVDSVWGTLRLRRLDLSVRRWMVSAFEHHMAYDHSGYPRVSKWPQQHLFSRIIAVAEHYDALTTERPWRDALMPDEALAQMLDLAGSRLDPVLVAIFINLVGRYPLGTMLLLSSGEVGVVYMTPSEQEHVHRPVVRLMLDRYGTRVQEVQLVDLREKDERGAFLRSAARVVKPEDLGVDLNRAMYF